MTCVKTLPPLSSIHDANPLSLYVALFSTDTLPLNHHTSSPCRPLCHRHHMPSSSIAPSQRSTVAREQHRVASGFLQKVRLLIFHRFDLVGGRTLQLQVHSPKAPTPWEECGKVEPSRRDRRALMHGNTLWRHIFSSSRGFVCLCNVIFQKCCSIGVSFHFSGCVFLQFPDSSCDIEALLDLNSLFFETFL